MLSKTIFDICSQYVKPVSAIAMVHQSFLQFNHNVFLTYYAMYFYLDRSDNRYLAEVQVHMLDKAAD